MNNLLNIKRMSSLILFLLSSFSSAFTVTLDPGHGGHDSGALGIHSKEKDITLTISKLVAKKLKAENIDVKLTRNKDIFIPLTERTAIANSYKSDIFISIHADSAPNKEAKCSSVFMISEKGLAQVQHKLLKNKEKVPDVLNLELKNDNIDESLVKTLVDLTQTATVNDSSLLGSVIKKEISKTHCLHSDTIGMQAFAVLKSPVMPSVLIETSFISNPQEERLLTDKDFINKLTDSIVAGIVRYKNKKDI